MREKGALARWAVIQDWVARRPWRGPGRSLRRRTALRQRALHPQLKRDPFDGRRCPSSHPATRLKDRELHSRDPILAPLQRLVMFAQWIKVRRMIESIPLDQEQPFWIMTIKLSADAA